jgi:UDP-3-O-[3-hydroxymyristoyl] glucosamine N-acyltransferase
MTVMKNGEGWTMLKKIGEIAEAIGAEVVGDPDLTISAIRSLEEAGEGDLTLMMSSKQLGELSSCGASAAIVSDGVECRGKTLLRTKNPMFALAKALELVYPKSISHPQGVHETAIIGKGARIGENVAIGPHSVIGDSCEVGDGTIIYGGVHIGSETRIGADCIIYQNVSVRERITIGNRVILQCGCVIGVDGFGYAFTEKGFYKVPQVGTVIIEDDVEVGGNSSIARAALEATVIGRNTKIDHGVVVGHNAVIGNSCIFSGQSGVAGSTRIGDGVICGGQVGIGDHLKVAGGVRLAGRSAVARNIDEPGDYMGTPAKPVERFRLIQACINKLPEVVEAVMGSSKKEES